MIMTNEEIIREYREAKTPLKQIGILADENQCSRGKIVEILRAAGMDLPAVCREKARTEDGGDLSTAARAPSPEGEAEYGPILPAPKLIGFAERVNDGAIEVIARMVADSDSSADQEEAHWSFLERVRGVLAMVYELRGGYGE
jgi:hypothetical protein